jgi:hypothetical protein
LPDVGLAGEHDATGTLLVLFGEQAISVQLFEDAGACGVQVRTPTALVRIIGQVVSVQLFDDWAGSATQVPVGTFSDALTLQVRLV